MQNSEMLPLIWWAYLLAQLCSLLVWVFSLLVRLVRGIGRGGLE